MKDYQVFLLGEAVWLSLVNELRENDLCHISAEAEKSKYTISLGCLLPVMATNDSLRREAYMS